MEQPEFPASRPAVMKIIRSKLQNHFSVQTISLLLAVAATLVLTGALILFPGQYILAGALMLVVFLTSFLNKTVAMAFIVVWMVFQYMPTRIYPLLPEQAVWFDDALVLFLTILWLSRTYLTGKFVHPTSRDWWLVVFIVIGIISTFLNSAPISIVAEGMRALIQPILIYYLFIMIKFSRRSARLILELLLVLMASQFFFYVLNGLNIGQWWGDYVYGTFGQGQGTGFGHFLTIGVFLYCGLFLYGEHRLWYLLLFVAILIPWVAASSRISYLSVPLILAWFLRRRILALRKSVLFFGVFLGMLLAGVYFSYSLTTRNFTFLENMNPVNIMQDQLKPNYSGRLIWYQYAWDKLTKSPTTLAFGYGPGMFSSFTAERNRTPMYEEINDIHKSQGFALYPALSFISVPVEFGLLGLLAYLGIIGAAYREVSRSLKTVKSKYWKGIIFGVKAALLYFIIAGITQNTWETPFVAGAMWLLVGIVYAIRRNETLEYHLNSLPVKQPDGA